MSGLLGQKGEKFLGFESDKTWQMRWDIKGDEDWNSCQERSEPYFQLLELCVDDCLEVKVNAWLVWEMMPGMECLSWQNAGEIGNR